MAAKTVRARSSVTVRAGTEEGKVGTVAAASKKASFGVVLGWMLLLLGGLAHMLPEQLAPALAWSRYGVSVQMVVGAVSVVVALYYLLGD